MVQALPILTKNKLVSYRSLKKNNTCLCNNEGVFPTQQQNGKYYENSDFCRIFKRFQSFGGNHILKWLAVCSNRLPLTWGEKKQKQKKIPLQKYQGDVKLQMFFTSYYFLLPISIQNNGFHFDISLHVLQIFIRQQS